MSPQISILCRFAPLGLLSVLVAGCVSIPTAPPQNVSFACDHPETTHLGRTLADAERSHPGMSGFHILDYGLESLVAHVTLADAAERTIDAQYYIYDSDEAGSILAEHLLAAADRGVRVRLLLDARVPAGTGPFPVAILVHGGGWSRGDKAGSDVPGSSADITPWFTLREH